ncbi:MAG: hypothetical protein K1060chlam5_01035 [Candidatus Anoxychlamydiales bacterium]|nr:hypothetical protein [Candidatus Anoxychlamydiales bacterium]
MKNFLTKKKWNPYVVGVFIGILSWLVFLVGNQLGTTTTFQKIAGLIEVIFAKSHVENSSYYQRYFKKALISWQMLFVASIYFGSLIASKLSKSKHIEYVPVIWKQNYGSSKLKRNIFAFIGGAILVFGARFAGGCTSGHAISGGLQLSVISWAFMISVFAVAIPFSMIIYRKSL